MSQEQKIAWLMVGAFVAGLILFAVLIPFVGIKVAPAGFSVVGFAGLGPLLFRKKRTADVIAVDERDKTIGQRATMVGGMISYEVFIFACMIPWCIYFAYGEEMISVNALPLIVGAGGVAFFASRSIVLLILYGRERGDGEK